VFLGFLLVGVFYRHAIFDGVAEEAKTEPLRSEGTEGSLGEETQTPVEETLTTGSGKGSSAEASPPLN
jgi:hypothetical protein